MKARIFRVGVALSSVLMMIEVLGAGKKWGH
ncbi:hypothetical protein BH24ACT26_BH24ACT26_04640 [soil metagenome]